MILTGKAKQDFEKGIIEILKQKYNEKIDDNKRAIDWIYNSNDLILLAHIIEWFDSVGIIIHTSYDIVDKKWGYEIFNDFVYNNDEDSFDIPMIHNVFLNRKEATKQSIIKANEIYNNLNK